MNEIFMILLAGAAGLCGLLEIREPGRWAWLGVLLLAIFCLLLVVT